MEVIIVSRHPAAVAFVIEERPELESAPVFASVTADDVRGKHVVGNLPMGLAAEAVFVTAIEFAGAPPRGQEYGSAEMREAGARLTDYKVTKI